MPTNQRRKEAGGVQFVCFTLVVRIDLAIDEAEPGEVPEEPKEESKNGEDNQIPSLTELTNVATHDPVHFRTRAQLFQAN